MKLIRLDSPVLQDTPEFWAELSRLARGVPLYHTLPIYTLATDASKQGWEVMCEHHMISGGRLKPLLLANSLFPPGSPFLC